MTYRLAAEMPTSCRISRPFDSRDDAVAFGRAKWPKMKQCHTQRILILDSCGEHEELWRMPTPYAEIPVGYYGVNGKRYHLDRPTEGKWKGWTFLTTGSDYHDRTTLAMVHPDGRVIRNSVVLELIAVDPFQRAAEYGQITGTCAACGRKLEDPVSRSIGMGPVCRKKFGVG